MRRRELLDTFGDRIRKHVHDARNMEPKHEVNAPRVVRRLRLAQSMAVFFLLDVNDWIIGTKTQAIWPTSTWPWIADLEAATPQIRSELDRYLAVATPPQVSELSGLDPDSDEGKAATPGLVGIWRTLLLYGNGGWIDETARHFPRTVELMARVPAKANVGFSALEPHSHIATHTGPNRGALRLQLPIIVPGAVGDTRIRVGDDIICWREGEAVVFDLSTNHEAWNDTDERRVLLMAELPTPLPVAKAWVNRIAQRAYRWHPSFRGLPSRVAVLERNRAAEATRLP